MFGSVTTPATFLNHRCSYSVATLGRDFSHSSRKNYASRKKNLFRKQLAEHLFFPGDFVGFSNTLFSTVSSAAPQIPLC